MMPSSVLVLFVSGWGGEMPVLADLASSYPLCMLQGGGLNLVDTYKTFGFAGISLSTALSEQKRSELRVADPDRFGLLSQSFDGGVAISHNKRQDVFVPFPPGMSIADAYESTLALQKKQVLAGLDDAMSKLILASFSMAWSMSLLRDTTALRQSIDRLSSTIEAIVEAAIEAHVPTLICSDTPRLAGMRHDPDGLLPCMLVHERVEGLRATPSDRTDSRDLPGRPTGHIDQVASTIAALVHLSVPPAAKQPLFASLLPRLRNTL